MHHENGRAAAILPADASMHAFRPAPTFGYDMRPFVGIAILLLKNSCANKITRVSCAAFALAAFFKF